MALQSHFPAPVRPTHAAHRCHPLAALRVLFAIIGAQAFVTSCLVLAAIRCPVSDRARLDVETLASSTRIFQERVGRLPRGIPELVEAGVFEREPLDPWHRPFRYWIVRGGPVFISLGRDGECGGQGDDADLASDNFLVHVGECRARDL